MEKIDPISSLSKMQMKIENLEVNNLNSVSNGGSIHYQDPGWKDPTIDIFNVSLNKCSSSEKGGGAYVNGTKYMNVHKAKINGTNANYGGAIGVYSSNFVSIQESTFSYSYSVNGGGAIHGDLAGVFYIVLCTFSYCMTDATGGAISLNQIQISDCIIILTNFYNCTANNGGSVYVNSDKSCSFEFSKICCYKSYVRSTTSQGLFLNVIGIGAQTNTLVNISSLSNLGVYGIGEGSLYVIKCGLECNNINFSKSSSYRTTSIKTELANGINCQYTTISGQRSSNHCNIYIISLVDSSGLIMFMNYINNSVGNDIIASQIYILNTYNKRLTIQFSLFQRNNGILFKTSNGTGTILVYGCYIYHSSINMTTADSASFEMTQSSNTESQTIPIAHYSTFYCADLQISNQDIELCPSFPPIPTTHDCLYSQSGSIITLSHIFASNSIMLMV